MVLLISLPLTVDQANCQQPLDDSYAELGLKLIDTKEAVAMWRQEKLPARATPKKGVFC